MTEPLATALGAAAGGLAAPATVVLARALAGPGARPLIGQAAAPLREMAEPLRRAGAEGVLPSDRERRRLRLAAGAIGLLAGTVLLGVLWGLALAALSAWLASRAALWRRDRYRRRVDGGASAAALALADALAGGHSVRGALSIAGRGLVGPIANELARVGRELELGARTEDALDRLRERTGSRRVALVVAAIQLQRRSGGSLAGLLRGIAASLEARDRLGGEARSASAQARFTSLIVLLLPACGLALGELASPGIASRMVGSLAGAWLLGSAAFLQVVGMLLIRRLSRLEE